MVRLFLISFFLEQFFNEPIYFYLLVIIIFDHLFHFKQVRVKSFHLLNETFYLFAFLQKSTAILDLQNLQLPSFFLIFNDDNFYYQNTVVQGRGDFILRLLIFLVNVTEAVFIHFFYVLNEFLELSFTSYY